MLDPLEPSIRSCWTTTFQAQADGIAPSARGKEREGEKNALLIFFSFLLRWHELTRQVLLSFVRSFVRSFFEWFRYFANEHSLQTHLKTKKHKRRYKLFYDKKTGQLKKEEDIFHRYVLFGPSIFFSVFEFFPNSSLFLILLAKRSLMLQREGVSLTMEWERPTPTPSQCMKRRKNPLTLGSCKTRRRMRGWEGSRWSPKWLGMKLYFTLLVSRFPWNHCPRLPRQSPSFIDD